MGEKDREELTGVSFKIRRDQHEFLRTRPGKASVWIRQAIDEKRLRESEIGEESKIILLSRQVAAKKQNLEFIEHEKAYVAATKVKEKYETLSKKFEEEYSNRQDIWNIDKITRFCQNIKEYWMSDPRCTSLTLLLDNKEAPIRVIRFWQEPDEKHISTLSPFHFSYQVFRKRWCKDPGYHIFKKSDVSRFETILIDDCRKAKRMKNQLDTLKK